MDRYATAKARLFSEHLTDDPNLAVVNWDDEYCNEVLRAAGGKFVQTYGMSEGTDFHIVDAVADRWPGAEIGVSCTASAIAPGNASDRIAQITAAW